MARLPSVRLADSDKLDESVSQIVTGVQSSLNHGLTVQDNMVGQTDSVSFHLAASPSPYPISFPWRYPRTAPVGCVVVRADARDGAEHITTALQPRWAYNNGRIVVRSMRGSMDTDTTYDLTFYTFA